MSSFFDEASLVMIPSGYKDQKVYSVKPLDGSGDLTFSRASSATRAANGLIEKVRTNYVLQSNTFNTTWASAGGGTTTATIGATDPNGGATAWTLAKTGAAGRIEQFPSLSGQVTLSIYAKAGTLNWIAVTNDVGVIYCNLNTGAFTLSSAGGSATSVGNGWYRITLTTATNANAFRIYPANGDGDVSGTSGNVLIWNAQMEAGDIATDYIATTSAAVSVGPVSGLPRLDYLNSSCPRLILEPQRSNLLLFSEQIDNAAWNKQGSAISANQAVSPDGYTNADLLYPTVNGSVAAAYQLKAISANTDYTQSVYVKAAGKNFAALYSLNGGAGTTMWVNLTTGAITNGVSASNRFATNVGNGWWRIGFTEQIATTNAYMHVYPTDAAGSAAVTANGTDGIYIYGAQLEAGAYATSYIPTLGTSVTRVADAASKSSATALIGQTEGTAFADLTIEKPTSGNADFLLLENTGTPTDGVYVLFMYQTGQIGFFSYPSGAFAYVNSVDYSGQRLKVAYAYSAAGLVIYINGTQVYSSGSVTLGTGLSTFGLNNPTAATISTKMSQTLIFKTRLSNAQLAELTTL